MDSTARKDAPKPVDRRHLLAGGAALAGAAAAKLVAAEPAEAGHNAGVDQEVMHVDVTNTTAGSTRISSNISGTAAFVALNDYPVGISRPDGMLGRTAYTTSNCAGVAGTCEADSGGIGVQGATRAANGVGVYGYSGSVVPNEAPPGGVGVFGRGANHGLLGRSNTGAAVQGETAGGIGLRGMASGGGTGVRGDASGGPNGVAVLGQAADGGLAGRFVGRTVVEGTLEVTGGLSATTVAATDGSFQRLYAPASPDPWLEDFGEARIVKGRAVVRLPKDFDDLVRSRDYQVFLTEYGNLGGVFVAKRGAHGFVVKARRGRRAKGRVGYRIVARRADVPAARAAKVAR
jgi:hypothetical protein